MLDQNPLSIKIFNGLFASDVDPTFGIYAQGDIPFSNALDMSNLDFLKKGGIRTRRGFEGYIANPFAITGTVQQIWQINNLNGISYNDRWLILAWDGTNGRMYDTGVTGPATNPVLNLVGMKYAFVINAFGRMYISGWSDWAVPLLSPTFWIYVYNGSYNARLAQGEPPTLGTFTAAVAAGGYCTPGIHDISVVYETDSGYRTLIAFDGPQTVTTTSANATINLTNIPIGPTGTVKRHIVMTRVIVNPSNVAGYRFEIYEPFYVLTIDDNTTTTGSISIADTGLLDSAKIRVNGVTGLAGDEISSTIRCCVSMAVFGNRMVYISPVPNATPGSLSNNAHYINISPPDLPEDVNASAYLGAPSRLAIGISYGNKVMAGAELNGVFYVFKDTSTWALSDNGDDPSTWKPSLIDAGKGAYPYGVALIGTNPANLLYGKLLVAGNHGISLFNGSFDVLSLTEGIWDNYTFADLKWSKIVVDPLRKKAFWKIGDPASSRSFCLFVDYILGLNINQLRFGKWDFPAFGNYTLNFRDIALRSPGTYGNSGVSGTGCFDAKYNLLVTPATYSGQLVLVSESLSKWDGKETLGGITIPISWYYETGYTSNNDGERYTFSRIRLRALLDYPSSGSPDITLQYGILDDTSLNLIGTVTPGLTPKKYLTQSMNAEGEKIRIKVSGNSEVYIQYLGVFAAQKALDRPRV